MRLLVYCVLLTFCVPCKFHNTNLPCPEYLTIDLLNQISADGTIRVQNLTFSKSDYYFNQEGKLKGCVCKVTKCIRKCCGPNHILTAESKCIPNRKPLEFVVYAGEDEAKDKSDGFYVIHNNTCSTNTAISLSPGLMDGGHFQIQVNGSVYVPLLEQMVSQDMYCVDYLGSSEGIISQVVEICLPPEFEEEEEGDDGAAPRMNSLGMMISMVFLLATFVVYALHNKRNVHVKSRMCYVVSLFFAYLFLVIIKYAQHTFSTSVCYDLGYICLFSFILSFYWMNVMCIDIWLGLSNFSRRRNSDKKFIAYCVYTLIMSTIHMLTVMAIQKYSHKAVWYFPGISHGQCFLSTSYARLLYFYAPVSILLIINTILFIHTAIKIRSIQRDTKVLKRTDSRKHCEEQERYRFNLYLKLLLAMGIMWSMEIISFIVDWLVEDVPPYIWYLTDFFNAAYGVVIFFLFVFKRQIWKLLCKRYHSLIGKPDLTTSSVSRRASKSMSSGSRTISFSVPAGALELESCENVNMLPNPPVK